MRVTREHERYCVDLRVDYSTRDAFVSNRVTNLSRGGLFIESDQPLPVATEVDLTLTLPGTEGALKACGRVIWNYDIQKGSTRVIRGMGIKLLDMGSDARRRLEKYIENLQPADALPASP